SDLPTEYSPLCPNNPDNHDDSANPDSPPAGGNAVIAGNTATGDDGASIWGRVMHANGKPAYNVKVTVSGPGDSRPAWTDPNGYYNFDELKPNTYSINANGVGLSVYVASKRRAIVNITIP